MAKQELLATIRDLYRASSRKDKSRILDEFIAVTGHHRKHVIRLLSQYDDGTEKTGVVKGRRFYDEAVGEAVPLLTREQSLVVAGLEAIAKQLPFPVLGIDSDNDSVLINDTLTGYCADRRIEFARSRAYRKNDQAWVEQKDGVVIRRFLGHERYSGQVAGQTIAHLHGVMRLYVNYFQPSFKLMEKNRHGSAVIKRYSPPATPCDRVIRHEAVSAEAKAALNERRAALDPVALLHAIREAQSALAAIVSRELRPTPRGESLERFLARLPDRWREEQDHAEGKPRARAPLTWRTRKDPFEGVWCDVQGWLQEDPDASVVAFLGRLQETEPDRFSRAHLRTLQRRVQQWRGIMADKLVYAASGATLPDPGGIPEMALVTGDPKC